jgi:hypothetical protein
VLIFERVVRRQNEETLDIVSCDWSIGDIRTDNRGRYNTTGRYNYYCEAR